MFFQQFDTFDPLSGDVPFHPFSYLPAIAFRARVLLNYRKAEQIALIARRISQEIDECFNDIKYLEIERLRQQAALLDEAGIIPEWHPDEDELDIQTWVNTNEVDALKSVLEKRDDYGFFQDTEPEPMEYPEGKDYELFAVLSLWLLSDVLDWLQHKKVGVPVQVVTNHCLSLAGEHALKAMDAVCYAEHLRESEWLVSYTKKKNNAELIEALHKQKTEQQKWVKYCSNLKKERERERKTAMARNAANVRHSKPGGSREKQEQILEIWATGKYTSRDICAEQENANLDMSYSAARKALRNQ